MKIFAFLISMILSAPILNAAIECTTIDTSSYDQEHKNFLHAATYRLMFEAGDNKVPTSVNFNTGVVCFDSPTANLETVLADHLVGIKITNIILEAQPTPAKTQADRYVNAKSALSNVEHEAILLRALSDILKDEINILRAWITDFKADVAASANLGELKTRVAANSSLADRTLAQLRTAIENRIDSGTVDS